VAVKTDVATGLIPPYTGDVATLQLGTVVFETTSECNQNCLYCYNEWKRSNRVRAGSGALAPVGYRTARRTLSRLFRQVDVQRITMSGGEPLLADRFSELVLYCRLKRKGVSVISNGSSAELDTYLSLIDLGVDLFEFTVNSNVPAVHDGMTAGSWQHTTTIIRELAKRVEVVCVIVLTGRNAADLDETILFIESLGVRRIMVNRFNPGGTGIRYADELLLTREQLLNGLASASRIARGHGLHVTSNVCTPWCVIHPREISGIRIGTCGADVEHMPITITASGDVRLCNHSPIVVGNVHRESMDRILSGERAAEFFGTIPEACRDCPDYTACRGGCRAVSEQLGVDISAHDPVSTSVRRTLAGSN